MHYLNIFLSYAAQYLKTKLAYRGDFLVYISSDFLLQSVNLVFILVVFSHIPHIQGWSKEEMLFIYGFFLVPFSLYSGLFNHLFDVPEKYVLQGELDRILVRPLNSYFQVVVELMNLELILGVIPGFAIMGYSALALDLQFYWWDIPLFIILSIGATMIYGGIYTLLASMGFWYEGKLGLMPMIYNLSNYGRYPTDIYKGVIRFVLTWILPFAFVGFYPATMLMHRKEYLFYGMLTPVIGVVIFLMGYYVWSKGINKYQGTGS